MQTATILIQYTHGPKIGQLEEKSVDADHVDFLYEVGAVWQDNNTDEVYTVVAHGVDEEIIWH